MEKQVNPQPLYPMKWHKFLIYFALWAGAVLNIAYGYRVIEGTPYTGRRPSIFAYPLPKPINIIVAILSICYGIFIIVTRFKLAHFKAAGPKYLTLVYAMGIVMFLGHIFAIIATTSLTIFNFGIQPITSSAVSIVIIILNRAYYNRRAELFVN